LAYPQQEPPATSLTILGVLAVSPEPSVKARTLWIGHAHTSCPYPRTHPADASAAWRRSPQMAAEPQPHAGALAGAATGPAGRTVQTPHAAAAAALSHTPGIDDGRSTSRVAFRNLPGLAGAIAKRPRRMGLRGEVADGGENLEDHPALASRYVRRMVPFQRTNSSWPR